MKLTQEIVRSNLDYNPETGALFWKPRAVGTTGRNAANGWFNETHAGKRAGTPTTGDVTYLKVTINRKTYYAHRLVWIYMTGEQPPASIDHIDGDGTNNCWANLRDGTETNRYNLSKYKNNTSGVTGVHWEGGSWRAVVRHNKKRHRLGRFKNIEDAEMAVAEFRGKVGAFTEDHGIR